MTDPTPPLLPLTAGDIAMIYSEYERRCGSHAPVALLVYLQTHPAPSSLTYLLVGHIQLAILERETTLYHARSARPDDHLARILAYKQCCDAVRIHITARLPPN